MGDFRTSEARYVGYVMELTVQMRSRCYPIGGGLETRDYTSDIRRKAQDENKPVVLTARFNYVLEHYLNSPKPIIEFYFGMNVADIDKNFRRN